MFPRLTVLILLTILVTYAVATGKDQVPTQQTKSKKSSPKTNETPLLTPKMEQEKYHASGKPDFTTVESTVHVISPSGHQKASEVGSPKLRLPGSPKLTQASPSQVGHDSMNPHNAPNSRRKEKPLLSDSSNLTPQDLGPGFASLVINTPGETPNQWRVDHKLAGYDVGKFSAYSVDPSQTRATVIICQENQHCIRQHRFFAQNIVHPGLLKVYGSIKVGNQFVDVVESHPAGRVISDLVQSDTHGVFPPEVVYLCALDLVGALVKIVQKNGILVTPNIFNTVFVSESGGEPHCKFTDYSQFSTSHGIHSLSRASPDRSLVGEILFYMLSGRRFFETNFEDEILALEEGVLKRTIQALMATSQIIPQQTYIPLEAILLDLENNPIRPNRVKSAKKVFA